MNRTNDVRRGRPRLEQPSVTVPVLLHLRPGEDDDLIRFFESIPQRQRANMLKSALRAGGMQTLAKATADAQNEIDELSNLLM